MRKWSFKVIVAQKRIIFLKFCLVGCSNVAITLSSFYFFYSFLGINYLVASVFGYSLGVLNSFCWNKLWTFKVKGTDVKKEFLRFLLVNLMGLGLNSLIMLFLVEITRTAAFFSQVIAVGIVVIFNFYLTRFWVFSCRSLPVFIEKS